MSGPISRMLKKALGIEDKDKRNRQVSADTNSHLKKAITETNTIKYKKRFRLKGFGRKTGRKRSKIYEAYDLEGAIVQASEDELIVDMGEIEELPDKPPTAAQIEYAQKIGYQIPKGMTKNQFAEIYRKLPKSATEKQLKLAQELGLKVPQNISKEDLTERLNLALQDSRIRYIYDNLPPTEAQKKFLDDLNIQAPKNVTRHQASQLIDDALEEEEKGWGKETVK
jgi:hypothetical protein